MTFTTKQQFDVAFKRALADGQFRSAAIMIQGNKTGDGWNGQGVSPWWIQWSKGVLSGKIKPGITSGTEPLPLWGGDDLFGEPITNGKRKKDA